MDTLSPLVASMLHRELPADVLVLRNEVLNQFPFTEALLVYGSVLRGESAEQTLVDFYVIVSSARGMAANWAGRFFGGLLPPNVYFVQSVHEGQVLRSKCTVVTAADFARFTALDTRTPYFWARFSQPCVLAYAKDSVAHLRVVEAVSQAVRTAYSRARALGRESEPLNQWTQLYRETYRTEIRPEVSDRAGEIVERNRDFYRAAAEAAAETAPEAEAWWLLRIEGKVHSVLRLCKAAFTFQGGADYAAWKIAKHTGEQIEVKDWQRKHPIIAGLALLPRLLRKRAIR